MMPLALADVGTENLIRKVGGSPEVKKHLEDLGFVAGGTATVVAAKPRSSRCFFTSGGGRHGRQHHRQGEGSPRGHQRGNGPEDHGMSRSKKKLHRRREQR